MNNYFSPCKSSDLQGDVFMWQAFIASDMTAFAKQSKFKTLNAFVFDICKEELINGK